jgi:hypothetical protein
MVEPSKVYVFELGAVGSQVVVTRASRRARPAGVLKYRTIA